MEYQPQLLRNVSSLSSYLAPIRQTANLQNLLLNGVGSEHQPDRTVFAWS